MVNLDNLQNSALITTLVGVLLLGASGYLVYSQQQSLSSGVQIEATVESKQVDRDSSRRGGIDFTPRVTYSYTYNGEQYTSQNIRPGLGTSSSNSRSDAEDRISQYEVGETTTAYVVEGSPSKSYLKKKTSIILPLMLGGFGALLLGRNAYRSLVG
jgi:Protein of unknown function (DUF3592).|nr:MAG: protein of unknown function, DUF3592 [Candidatus Nanosalinarum sp. J07AB56]